MVKPLKKIRNKKKYRRGKKKGEERKPGFGLVDASK